MEEMNLIKGHKGAISIWAIDIYINLNTTNQYIYIY